MEAIKYLELAVSKDKARGMLNHIYRDRSEMVAADGDRLHLVASTPTDSPGYLNPDVDATFPDWKMVLPKGDKSLEFDIGDSSGVLIKKLKLLVALFKATGTKQPIAKLIIRDREIELFGSSEDAEIGIRLNDYISMSDNNYSETLIELGINPTYLIDALSPCLMRGNYTPCTVSLYDVKLKAGSDSIRTTLSPIKIECEALKSTAILMPMRIK